MENDISTHTLARRVTTPVLVCRKKGEISTHTLARRVTRRRMRHDGSGNHFNPHPRTEGDSTLPFDAMWRMYISTHTLARRVTELFDWQGNAIKFQPTPSHGG